MIDASINSMNNNFKPAEFTIDPTLSFCIRESNPRHDDLFTHVHLLMAFDLLGARSIALWPMICGREEVGPGSLHFQA